MIPSCVWYLILTSYAGMDISTFFPIQTVTHMHTHHYICGQWQWVYKCFLLTLCALNLSPHAFLLWTPCFVASFPVLPLVSQCWVNKVWILLNKALYCLGFQRKQLLPTLQGHLHDKSQVGQTAAAAAAARSWCRATIAMVTVERTVARTTEGIRFRLGFVLASEWTNGWVNRFSPRNNASNDINIWMYQDRQIPKPDLDLKAYFYAFDKH